MTPTFVDALHANTEGSPDVSIGVQKAGGPAHHERSVHLSLVNLEQQSVAYRCRSKDAFDRGLCLSCRKNRCNYLGYGAHRQHTTKVTKMYLKTTDNTPFKGSAWPVELKVL
ncbi:unnamed protein product [Merluccius merluccius]